MTGSGGKKFLINMCGPAEPTSTSSCKHAMVCSDGISYGEPKNYQVEKESRQLKLNYAAGEKCASGGTAQSHIIFSCDRSGLGSPEFSTVCILNFGKLTLCFLMNIHQHRVTKLATS